MRVVGVDPGLRITGYGFIEARARGDAAGGGLLSDQVALIETGTIQPSPKDRIQDRLADIHRILGDLLDQYHPTVMVLEKLYAHARHPVTVSVLGHVRGVICLLCAQKGIALEEHSPKRVRQSVTGNGNASKDQIRRVIARRFGIPEQRLGLDASDALALALAYLRRRGTA